MPMSAAKSCYFISISIGFYFVLGTSLISTADVFLSRFQTPEQIASHMLTVILLKMYVD